MSRFSDRLHDVIRFDISDDDAVAIWNHYADLNNYEHIYPMNLFDEIIDTNRPYKDVLSSLNKDFVHSVDYFYCNEAIGKWTSLENPFDLVDADVLANLIIRDDGYDGVAEVSDLFDGSLFESDISYAIENLSIADIKKAVIIFGEDLEDYDDEDLSSVLLDSLEEIYNDDNYKDIYLMPEVVQSVFWGLKEADINYIKDNIGRVGPLEPKKALEIAGFDQVKKDIYKYVYADRTKYFNIKIKGNKIADVKMANLKQIEEAVR